MSTLRSLTDSKQLSGKIAERIRHLDKKAATILTVIVIASIMNLMIFGFAYPRMFEPNSPTLARDFSAYYSGAWRLFHNPTKIYAGGSYQLGDYPIVPTPQTFKYAPSFFLIISPFLVLSYQDAYIAFNFMQLALFPLLGYFVFKLVKGKSLTLAIIAAIVVLLNPLPGLPITQAEINLLHYRFHSFNVQSFSVSYYWGWVAGQAHILQNIFLVGALYFGFSKKPWLSAFLFAFGSFDPRFSLLVLPLLLWYNRKSLAAFVAGSSIFLTVMNLPFFLYQGIGAAFFDANFRTNIVSQMYSYDWIPFYSILTLTLVELFTVVDERAKVTSYLKEKASLVTRIDFF